MSCRDLQEASGVHARLTNAGGNPAAGGMALQGEVGMGGRAVTCRLKADHRWLLRQPETSAGAWSLQHSSGKVNVGR